jgi:hypothetical protein
MECSHTTKMSICCKFHENQTESKVVGTNGLNYQSSRSDFGFEFAEIFEIEKRLPASVIAGS